MFSIFIFYFVGANDANIMLVMSLLSQTLQILTQQNLWQLLKWMNTAAETHDVKSST